MEKELIIPGVFWDNNRHTCIAIGSKKSRKTKAVEIEYIPMDSEGLTVLTAPLKEFMDEFKQMVYEVTEAAKKYLMATHISISERAQAELEALVNEHPRPKLKSDGPILSDALPNKKSNFKEPPPPSLDLIPLKRLCSDLEIDPALARRVLRKSKVVRTGRWEFTASQVKELTPILLEAKKS